MNTFCLKGMLKSLQVEADDVHRGEDCLRLILRDPQCCPYRLLLLDYNMPVMSGLDVIKKIIEHFSQKPL